MFLTASGKDDIRQKPANSDFLTPYLLDLIISGAVLNGAIVAPTFVPLLMAWQLFGLPWEI